MSKCAGCFTKFKRFDKSQTCPECRRIFCLICIPGKKVVQDSRGQKVTEGRDVCVYCTREQKERMKKEEIEAVGNFHNRYYQNPHLSSNTTTVVKKAPVAVAAQPAASVEPSADSDDIKKIEERLQRLKEPVGGHGNPSEGDIKNRLENLRGPPGPEVSEGDIKRRLENSRDVQPSSDTAHVPGQRRPEASASKTETQEAQNLLEKATDELALDKRLAGTEKQKGSDLPTCQQALTSVEYPDSIGGDMQRFLDEIEVELPDEDPVKLLEELKGKVKGLAPRHSPHHPTVIPGDVKTPTTEDGSTKPCAEVTGGGLRSPNATGGVDGVNHTSGAHGSDAVKDISGAHGDVGVKDVNNVSSAFGDVGVKDVKDIGGALGEVGVKDVSSIHQEGVKGNSGASGGGLQQDTSLDSDCTVREKPRPERGWGGGGGLLQFSWDHFGASSRGGSNGGGGGGRGGLREDQGVDDDCMDDEVHQLIAQVLEETELESKMEATGHGHIVQDWDHRSSDRKPQPQGEGASAAAKNPSGGASAAAYTYSDFGKEELPWCCICNDDAALRCFDCDGDLYCRRCYAEGHEQFGLYGHHVEAFQPPQKR